MRLMKTCFRFAAGIPLILSLPPGWSLGAEPGVDVAAPRFTISTVGDFIGFQPAGLVIEQGDWIRWRSTAATLSHTATSGNPCVANLLWSGSLPPGAQFTRQFAENPGPIPYFCSPHCGLGMTGQITVTTRISLVASDTLGTLSLSWTGGGGAYRVFRSDTPAFIGPNTVSFAPTGGDAGTTFSEALPPAADRVLYYLVMNKP